MSKELLSLKAGPCWTQNKQNKWMSGSDLFEPYLMMTYLVLNFIRPTSKRRDLPNKPRMHANLHLILFGDLGGWLCKKEKFWLVSEARWSAAIWIVSLGSGVYWNPQHKGKLRMTPSRARAKIVFLLCPVSWSDCLSRQVEDKQPCGHYRRPHPHLVQPRNEDQWGRPVEDANPKNCLFSSTRRAGPHQARTWTWTKEARHNRKTFLSAVP